MGGTFKQLFNGLGGSEYIYSVLLIFSTTRGKRNIEGKYYNEYFTAAMDFYAPPLSDGLIEYADGTQATVDQMHAMYLHF